MLARYEVETNCSLALSVFSLFPPLRIVHFFAFFLFVSQLHFTMNWVRKYKLPATNGW